MKKYTIFLAALLAAAGCSKNVVEQEDTDFMRFRPCLGSETKATDTEFENGDAVGVFVVTYDDGIPSPLQISGNWANNAKATASGSSWTVAPSIWWKDGDVKYDVFAYYPFNPDIRSVDDYIFDVAQDQNGDGFTKSDLMWAKSAGVERSADAVPLNFKHKLSRLDINLIKGDDYEGDLPETAEVRVMNTVTSASINLESGDVEKNPYGTEHNIVAKKTSTGKYSAIIVPQKLLNQVPLVEVIVNNISYLVSTRFIFESGVRHTLDIKLSSDPNKVIISIGGKIEDWN